jgi:hypothetical protein
MPTLASSEATAIRTMEMECERSCAKRGIRREDLVGPTASPRNAKSGNSHFEYTWKYPNGSALVNVSGGACLMWMAVSVITGEWAGICPVTSSVTWISGGS